MRAAAIPGDEIGAFRVAVRKLYYAWWGSIFPRSQTDRVGGLLVVGTVLRHVVPVRSVGDAGVGLYEITGALEAASNDVAAMSTLTEQERDDVTARIAAATERDDLGTDWDQYEEDITMNLVITATSFTVPQSNLHVVVRDCGAPVTITLPAVPTGYQVVLLTHDDANGHVVTIEGNGFPIEFSGDTSLRLETQGVSITLAFDGTKWLII